VVDADLALPQSPFALVVFAHGSGSSRHSPRNRSVAGALNRGGLATLMVDLLTPKEEAVDAATRAYRFDIPLLVERLRAAIAWAVELSQVGGQGVGLFGSSTGAAAALIAAARRPEHVFAVVSRGGRTDLAAEALARVRSPTLLIVGSLDPAVFQINRESLAQLRCVKRLEVVPGATHLFEEPGALERVAQLALAWFVDHAPRSAL
jgi:pimeloyl-ACP methyl ester carboxylesterase